MTRERLLARKPKIVPVEVDGETFHIKVLTLAETNAWQAASAETEATFGKSAAVYGLLVRTLVDEAGERLFKDDEIQLAVDTFTGPEGSALSLKAIEINKLSKEEPTQLADAAKN